MKPSHDLTQARRATQWIFLVCGLGISTWAPMVPFAKERLGLDDGDLGFLLLLLGFGALIVMPISGMVMGRIGSRRMIRSEEHTSELQSRGHLVCRLLLEKKKK